MKLLHLSTYDSGGAGSLALGMHRGVLGAGADSRFLVMESRTGASDVEAIGAGSVRGRLEVATGQVWSRLCADQDHYFPRGHARAVPAILGALQGFRPDVLVAHWLSRFLAPQHLATLATTLDVPVVWVLHDMAPFTGGCHFPIECQRYRNECGACVAIGSKDEDDLSRRNLMEKERALAGITIVGVAHGQYTAALARASRLFRHRQIETLAPGVDLQSFRPGVRDAERDRLGWPRDCAVVLTGSQLAEKRRKGGALLAEAMRGLGRRGELRGRRVLLAVVGQTTGKGVYDDTGVEVRKMGYLDRDALIAAYRAADLYACPSLQDTGPLMVAEALACGTPVAGFPVGICPDLVVEGETGALANPGDAGSLAAAITRVLDRSEAAAGVMREACRRAAQRQVDRTTQTQAFLDLCSTVVARHRESGRAVA